MLYNLSNYVERDRFQRRVEALLKTSPIVELTEKKLQRTLPQNSYLHLILGWFALEHGLTIDYVKSNYFKKLCNNEIFVVVVDDTYLGQVEKLRSSRDLDSAEMTTAIERFRKWSAETAGFYLPSPNEKEWLLHIELEINHNKQYL